MADSLPPSLVLALAFIAVTACVVVAAWNIRLGRKLRAIDRAHREHEAALRHEREEYARAQASAQATLEAERELVGLKTRFVSLVSHEFRTPLGIIMSAGELLKNYRDRLTEENKRELFDDILGSTRRMSALMEQVLLLGRVDAGKVAARPVPLDLVALLEKLCDEQRSASGDRCPIRLEKDGDLAGASADAGLLRHVLTNFVSNAVKYSAAGAEVRLIARRSGDAAVFEVRDQGIGIPEADQARLFEAFHRASNVGEIPGSGLGLLIVKRCVDLHDGHIQVRSRPGEGTVFTVELPLFARPQPAEDAADDAPRNIASRMVA